MNLFFALASETDAPAIASLRSFVSEALVKQNGPGHWGYEVTEKSVTHGISRTSKVVIARLKNKIVGTLRLATKKPWAIDPAYFTPANRPLYLLDMAVSPEMQGKDVGRQLISEALNLLKAWPTDAIRLDTYDAYCRSRSVL